MNKPARLAISWSIILYVLNTFIGPTIGINKFEITLTNVIANFFIWGAAGIALYLILKRKQKKDAQNEKMD